jgi:hypothetical protein
MESEGNPRDSDSGGTRRTLTRVGASVAALLPLRKQKTTALSRRASDAVVVELRVFEDHRHRLQGIPLGVHLGGGGADVVADEVGGEAGVEAHGWGECKRGCGENNQPCEFNLATQRSASQSRYQPSLQEWPKAQIDTDWVVPGLMPRLVTDQLDPAQI